MTGPHLGCGKRRPALIQRAAIARKLLSFSYLPAPALHGLPPPQAIKFASDAPAVTGRKVTPVTADRDGWHCHRAAALPIVAPMPGGASPPAIDPPQASPEGHRSGASHEHAELPPRPPAHRRAAGRADPGRRHGHAHMGRHRRRQGPAGSAGGGAGRHTAVRPRARHGVPERRHRPDRAAADAHPTGRCA